VLRNYVAAGTRWLDLGCGHQVLPAWRSAEEQLIVARSGRAVGLDYELRALKEHQSLTTRVRGDITKLPFKDNSFTLVTANMVLEHLDSPAIQCREIQRVLAPNGILLCHTPNVLGYTTILARLIPQALRLPLIALLEGRREEDVFKTHYRANSPRRLTVLARQSGLEPLSMRTIVSTATSAVITPLAVLELLWIRVLMTSLFRPLRTNLIGIFRKSDA
jgi:ubiquinone/menaquinone biosynthesis C-methylase UbiE